VGGNPDLTSTFLQVTDANSANYAPSQLTYTITSAPSHGYLLSAATGCPAGNFPSIKKKRRRTAESAQIFDRLRADWTHFTRCQKTMLLFINGKLTMQ
jgi:hypothetical protein